MSNQQNPLTPDALAKILAEAKNHQPPQLVCKRGAPYHFSELSFLMLAMTAVILRTFKDSELHRLLRQDSGLRETLGFVRVPDRTTIGRRLVTLVPVAESRIAELGRTLLAETAGDEPNVSAVDGRMYEAVGPKWHKSSRDAGEVPVGLRNVDTDSTWSKSAYRGWIQGFRLVTQSLVFPFPVPLAAVWRPNSTNEASVVAAGLDEGLFHKTDVLLGDSTFGAPDFVGRYEKEDTGWVLSSKQLPKGYGSWKQRLYAYRRETVELLFQRIMQAVDLKCCPVKGFARAGAFVLAGVWLYQILVLRNLRAGTHPTHVKEQIDAARWRLSLAI
jgi:hypothetical protein